MKETTNNWIKSRIQECNNTLNTLKKENESNTNTKRYWGILQELNTLSRILRMEGISI